MCEKDQYEQIKREIKIVFDRHKISNYFCVYHKDNWLLDTLYFILDNKDPKFDGLSSLLYSTTELFIDYEKIDDIC